MEQTQSPLKSPPQKGFNYRRRFNQAAMDELVADISRQGVLQSILVRGNNPEEQTELPQMIKISDIKAGKYQVIAGNRRVQAA
jgi:ParB-like chromosome segregation protein Spo0J